MAVEGRAKEVIPELSNASLLIVNAEAPQLSVTLVSDWQPLND